MMVTELQCRRFAERLYKKANPEHYKVDPEPKMHRLPSSCMVHVQNVYYNPAKLGERERLDSLGAVIWDEVNKKRMLSADLPVLTTNTQKHVGRLKGCGCSVTTHGHGILTHIHPVCGDDRFNCAVDRILEVP